MPTNSKSGELFLFSSDRQFIIKTLSGKEPLDWFGFPGPCSLETASIKNETQNPRLMLLARMMPAYFDHIQHWPRSLIVRYAGSFTAGRSSVLLSESIHVDTVSECCQIALLTTLGMCGTVTLANRNRGNVLCRNLPCDVCRSADSLYRALTCVHCRQRICALLLSQRPRARASCLQHLTALAKLRS